MMLKMLIFTALLAIASGQWRRGRNFARFPRFRSSIRNWRPSSFNRFRNSDRFAFDRDLSLDRFGARDFGRSIGREIPRSFPGDNSFRFTGPNDFALTDRQFSDASNLRDASAFGSLRGGGGQNLNSLGTVRISQPAVTTGGGHNPPKVVDTPSPAANSAKSSSISASEPIVEAKPAKKQTADTASKIISPSTGTRTASGKGQASGGQGQNAQPLSLEQFIRYEQMDYPALLITDQAKRESYKQYLRTKSRMDLLGETGALLPGSSITGNNPGLDRLVDANIAGMEIPEYLIMRELGAGSAGSAGSKSQLGLAAQLPALF